MIDSESSFESYGIAADSWQGGSEHLVEFSPKNSRFAKVTKPVGFGLVPKVRRIESKWADPAKATLTREALEFFPATPIEYLERWQASNVLFGDDVHLASVVRWKDGAVSFVVTQPQYHGEPADEREIVRYFGEAGWEQLKDPSGHLVFYNYALGTIAVDAAPRNCYINEGGLQPFDVILCRPNRELAEYLGIEP